MSNRSPGAVDRDVGLRVHQARLMREISQTDLGAALGVSFQQVQKYEKGTNRIGCSQLARIAATLDRPVAWFFAGTPAGRAANFGASPDPCQLLGCTRDGLRLAIAFNAIADRTTRGAIVAVAETTAHALAPAARRRAA